MSFDIGKWNYQTKEYDPYEIPSGVVICLYSQDMDLPINCTSCFKLMTYGQGYTSRELHNHIGLGYPVCDDCYAAERERERLAKNA